MRPTGTIIAPPKPCTARAMIKPSSVSVKAQAKEASVKTAIASRNTCRAPKRSAIQPLIGIKTAKLKRLGGEGQFEDDGVLVEIQRNGGKRGGQNR